MHLSGGSQCRKRANADAPRATEAEALGQFSEADRKALEGLVSPEYLEPSRMVSLCKDFEDQSQLRLGGFLKPESERLQLVSEALRSCDLRDAQQGWESVGGGWRIQGPVLQRRCCIFRPKRKGRGGRAKLCPAGKALAEVAEVLKSPAFLRYLLMLTGASGSKELFVQRILTENYFRLFVLGYYCILYHPMISDVDFVLLYFPLFLYNPLTYFTSCVLFYPLIY